MMLMALRSYAATQQRWVSTAQGYGEQHETLGQDPSGFRTILVGLARLVSACSPFFDAVSPLTKPDKSIGYAVLSWKV